MAGARYLHVNLIARDANRLSDFYRHAFGFVALGPERTRSGPWLDQLTGIPNAEIRVVHLRLEHPRGATADLEITSYARLLDAQRPALNRPGFGHMAFEVDDIHAVCAAVIASGGSAVAEIVSFERRDGGTAMAAYVRDPEGNILELIAPEGAHGVKDAL